MPHDHRGPSVRLPRNWHRHVRSSVLHVISLAQFVVVHTRGWAVNSINARIRLKAEADRLTQEVALLREETPHQRRSHGMHRSSSASFLCSHRTDGDPRVAGRSLPGPCTKPPTSFLADASHDRFVDEACE